MDDFDFEIYALNFHSFTFKIHTGIDNNLQNIECDRQWILEIITPLFNNWETCHRYFELREDTPKNSPFSLLNYGKIARLFDSNILNSKAINPHENY